MDNSVGKNWEILPATMVGGLSRMRSIDHYNPENPIQKLENAIALAEDFHNHKQHHPTSHHPRDLAVVNSGDKTYSKA